MNTYTADDVRWMAEALRLARQGLYTTTPNPRVGCVLVKQGEVVGAGWHYMAGEPHAEVHALAAAGAQARGATAYVTLEPCSHTGRTPPCADALIAAGVSRVVAAAIEQNHDDKGMIFPVPLAPFQVMLLNLSPNDPVLTGVADGLYQTLQDVGVEVLYDDRDERPGAKFNDADLLGVPLRLTVGKTYEKNGQVELRERRSGTTTQLDLQAVVPAVQAFIREQLASCAAS